MSAVRSVLLVLISWLAFSVRKRKAVSQYAVISVGVFKDTLVMLVFVGEISPIMSCCFGCCRHEWVK